MFERAVLTHTLLAHAHAHPSALLMLGRWIILSLSILHFFLFGGL